MGIHEGTTALYLYGISSQRDIKNPISNNYVVQAWRTCTAKILTQIKMPKENARKKAVKPKFHRLSFLKRGDVNK